MELVIISGMSGAGKSRAIAVLEDAGFYCIDNMPTALIPKFAEICYQSGGKIDKMALVTDIRGLTVGGNFIDDLRRLKESGYNYKLLFLDASNETLIARYKETRRLHPLSDKFNGRMEEAIDYERKLLAPLIDNSDFVIDTSKLMPNQLRENILALFVKGKKAKLIVNVVSFGFKYGAPSYADLVFDVRCLPNPYYVLELKSKTGKQKEVYDYVFKFDSANRYFDYLSEFVRFLIPLFSEEGKVQVTIAIGCTGGHHRSVAMAERLFEFLKSGKLATCTVEHRDILK